MSEEQAQDKRAGGDRSGAMERAVAFLHQGRLDEAKSLCESVLSGDAQNVDALYALGWIALSSAELDTALELFRRVIEGDPRHARAHNNIATILLQAGDAAAAAGHLEAAVAADPEFAQAFMNLGAARLTVGKPALARDAFAKAVGLTPDDADALTNLGTAKMQLGEVGAAVEDYRKAVALKPGHVAAQDYLTQALRREGRLAECLEALDRGLAACSGAHELLTTRGNVLKDLGRLEEAVAAYRQALAVDSGLPTTRSNLIYAMKFMPAATSSEIKAEVEAFGAVVGARARPFTQWNVTREPDKRLRVGMVSGDLRTHVVGFYLQSFLHHLDPTRVELAAYSTAATEDETTARLKPHFALWRRVKGLADGKLAALIHEDQVDILIDLSGHSGRNRLPMFAFKPAPVQASWLGLFVTTGVPGMDYIIADPHLVADEEKPYFTEEVWPLAESWFCLSPPAFDVEPGPLPALSAGCVTFGCFSNLTKVSDRAVSAWARVLQAVPGARLFMKAKQLQEPIAREATLARFRNHGIGPERLLLEGSSPPEDYFAAYRRVDIALDPFPYHGATTSLDGLWMGVPMVTLRGERVGAHLGESIAHAAGLANWIAGDEGSYAAIAAEKASDLAALAALRAGLRARVLGTTLFDGARFARQLEEAFHGMWRKFAG